MGKISIAHVGGVDWCVSKNQPIAKFKWSSEVEGGRYIVKYLQLKYFAQTVNVYFGVCTSWNVFGQTPWSWHKTGQVCEYANNLNNVSKNNYLAHSFMPWYYSSVIMQIQQKWHYIVKLWQTILSGPNPVPLPVRNKK